MIAAGAGRPSPTTIAGCGELGNYASGNADHDRLQDGGLRQQGGLDPLGRDVSPVGSDQQVLASAGQAQMAALVEFAQVAGRKLAIRADGAPDVAEKGGSADHDLVAVDANPGMIQWPADIVAAADGSIFVAGGIGTLSPAGPTLMAVAKLLGDTLGHGLAPSAELRQIADLGGAAGTVHPADDRLADAEPVIGHVAQVAEVESGPMVADEDFNSGGG